jgi:LPXTG-motif cell wall-anchored protein
LFCVRRLGSALRGLATSVAGALVVGLAVSASPVSAQAATIAPREAGRGEAARAAAEPSIGILAAGVPEAPASAWTEGFTAAGVDLLRLGTYGGNAYTADTFWLDYANCNGVIVTYNTTQFSTSDCTATNAQNQLNARVNVRRLADVLGQVAAGTVGSDSATAPTNGSTEATRNNRALAEWTSAGTGAAGGTRVLERVTATGLTASAPRYYTASLDVVEASCSTTAGRSQITMSLVATSGTITGSTITACTDARAGYYTSPLVTGQTGWVLGGDSVRAGRFTSDAALLVPANQLASLRPIVRNLNVGSGGNDFAVDNLRILDVTPSLDTAFSPATVTAGVPSTLTFTVTNTSELGSKNDWSFTDTLPSGLVVAATPAVGGTCANSTGTAFAVQAAAGSGTIAVTGGDLTAGTASCTVTVNVVAATAGTYTNGAGNVTTVLNAPDSATLVVEEPTRLTVQKNVTGRATAGDQFRLAVTAGGTGTEVASATTTGTATGLQAQRVGPITVTPGASYTISESIVSSATLNTYTSGYECVRGSTTIATGTSVSGSITIPNEPGANIVCTFTNTPQAASLYCDGTYFYAVRANGSIAQVNAASTATPTQLVGAVTGATDVNALGVNADGTGAFAVDRATGAANVASVIGYAITSGSLQASRTVLTTAQGTLQDRSGAALAGTIVGGAVDPLTGRYILGKSAAGFVRLWEYTPGAVNNGSRFLYLGQVATGTTAIENGDIAFDAQGNLHIVQTASDSSNVAMFSVTRQTYSAATGGTLTASGTVRRALSGTDANNALTAVNGMAFSPSGTVYLGNGTIAYQFDPTTWVRVAGTSRATIGTTATGAGSTDLAGCTSPSTLQVEKNVVGRVNALDQFRLAVSAGSPAVESSVATTTGSATGVQATRIGPMPVQINTSVTISETMASGSVSPLTAYTSVYECWADGIRIFAGTEKSATITIPNRLSVGVACTFTNSPAPFATVRVSKFIEGWDGGDRAAAPGWTVTTTAVANAGSTATSLPSRDPSQQTGADGSATWQVLFGAASHRARITVAETTQAGYRYQALVCTVNGTAAATTVTTVDGQIRGAVNLDVGPSATVECAFTNRPVATLTLVKNVAYGTADPSAWQLTATRSVSGALPGPTGPGGSGTISAVPVSAGVAYRLAETGGPSTYVQVGSWSCLTATGTPVAVSAAGDITLARGTTVVCTATNSTASLTLLKNVPEPRPGFQPADWNLTATPSPLAGLSAVTRGGVDVEAGGNAANTFEVRPGHSYTLSEALAATGSRTAYRQLRLELRQADGTWTAVASTTITAPPAGQTAVYRFVNVPVQPTTLPLTGGTSADAFLLAGGAVLALSLALALWHAHRRRRGAIP